MSTEFYYYNARYSNIVYQVLEIELKQRVSNNIYNNQYDKIEMTICSTPDASVLYQ